MAHHTHVISMQNPKTIVVTGGAGFIGTRLCARLSAMGHKVISLDNYFTGSEASHVPGVDYRRGHTKAIAKHIHEKPDLIFHLGEYPHVEHSLNEPELVWDLNITGTLGVMEFWRNSGAKLVYAGSSTKYAEGGSGRNQSPYAFSKATNTKMVANYSQWYSLPHAITYFYNVYGEGERAGKYGTVIEIFRQKYINNETLTVTSPGTQQRIFTHIDDIVDGLILIGEHGEGDEFGLGAAKAYSILEIADMFGGNYIMTPEVKGNRMDSTLDDSRATALGWSAKRQLKDYIDAILLKKAS